MKKYFVIILLLAISLFGADGVLSEANLLFVKNKYTEAANLYEQYLESKEDPDVYLKLGLCYKNLMKTDRALSVLEKANQLKNDDQDILVNLGVVYSSAGFFSKAVVAFERAVDIDTVNVFAKINLAKLYVTLDRVQEAQLVYKDLLAGDSANAYYYKQLGLVYQKLKDEKTAKSFYKKSFTLSSSDLTTINNLALIYYGEKEIDSAVAVIDTGLVKFDNDIRLLKLKADILFSEKEYGGAVNVIVKIMADKNESAELYQKLGICYYEIAMENFVGDAQSQKLESAVETLDISFKEDSTQCLTALYLGLAYKGLSKNDQAIKSLKKAVDLIYPGYAPAVFTNLALINQEEKNYPEAIKYFKEAQKLDAENPNYWYYLAALYDSFYYDKNTPMLYFQKFLASRDSLDERLMNYAKDRIDKLKEDIHFQNGHKH